jgi:AmmeMemoRadiSam system protein B
MSPTPTSSVRPSAIAGTWYPGSAAALRRTIEGYLDQVRPVTLPGRLLALVSPHAGYAYSGPTAAYAYAQARGQGFKRVVLLGPLHRPVWGSRLGPFMVPAEDAYRTPLGDVPVDHTFIAELGKRIALTTVRGDEEHSLEIQLPFLQVVLGAFDFVPIMVGEQISDPGAAARLAGLAAALAEVVDESTLLVASTDLSHLHNYTDVVRIDHRLVELVAAFDVGGLSAALQAEEVLACGAAGLVTVLQASQKLGAQGAQVLAYTCSGDVTGDKRPGQYCVGYLAAAVYA